MTHEIRNVLIAAAVTGFAWAMPGAAQEVALDPDQVHGEIVEVSPERDLLRLRVEQAGDERAASAGDVVDYRLEPDTTIRMEDPFTSVTGAGATSVTVDDLEPGQRVTLNFEDIEGEMVARDVSVSEERASDTTSTAATTDAETQSETEFAPLEEERDTLPATASMLPLLGALGVVFGLMGIAIRWMRRR